VAVIAVVAYPQLSPSDREWIEAVRAREDPQARRIALHFTLVFPLELPADDVAAHAAAVSTDVEVSASRRVVRGTLDEVHVIEVGGDEVRTVRVLPLRSPVEPEAKENVQ
jgi:hypothetical protein